MKTLQDHISMLTAAAEVRQQQWDMAANMEGCLDAFEVVAELFEADTAECENMAKLIDDALKYVEKENPIYAEETAMTAMAMWEWFCCDADHDEKDWWNAGGAVQTRATFLKHAHFLDEAWTFAHYNFGYGETFDWEFVPCYMQAAYKYGAVYEDLGRDQVHILKRMGIS